MEKLNQLSSQELKKLLDIEYFNIDSNFLITILSFYNNQDDGITYVDFDFDSNPIICEFLTLYFLYQENKSIEIVNYNDAYEIALKIQNIAKIYLAKAEIELNDKVTSTRKLDFIEGLANGLRVERSKIRNPGFPFHHEELMIELFQAYEDKILKELGFSYNDAAGILKIIPSIIQDNIDEVLAEYKKFVGKLKSDILYFRKKTRLRSSSLATVSFINSYQSVKNIDLKDALWNSNHEELIRLIYENYRIRIEDFEEYSDIDSDTVAIVLEYFVLSGSEVSKFYSLNEGYSPLSDYPLVKIDESYLISNVANFSWALESRVDKDLKSKMKGRLVGKYKNYRHDFLLNKAISYLDKLIKNSNFTASNLYYEVDSKRCEVDGIIIVDNVALVIEFKSQRITDRAKKGYIDRFVKHVNEIIDDSYSQANRAIDYMLTGYSFSDENGKLYNLRKYDIEKFIPVSISLEQLGHQTVSLKNIENGYFDESNFPWIVNIYDLKIISDLLRNSSELLYYIDEREKFLKIKNVEIHDELDIFSYFLSRHLEVSSLFEGESKYDFGYMSNATDEINHYYFNQYGLYEVKVQKPTFKIPDGIIDFISKINTSNLRHYTEVSKFIYSFSSESYSKFESMLKQITKKHNKDGEVHDLTMQVSDNDGMNPTTISVVISSSHSEADEYLSFIMNRRDNDPKVKYSYGLSLIKSKKSISVIDIRRNHNNIIKH